MQMQPPEAVAAPTFYLEDLYPAYENGTAPEDIAESMISYARQNNLPCLPGNIDIESYEGARKSLGLTILGVENNREYLEDMVYEQIEDLALIPILFSNDSYGPGCIKIRKCMAEDWGVSEEELMRDAKENAPHLLPLTFKQLNEALGEEEESEDAEVFVISNRYLAGGAAVAFYPHVLESIGKALGKDLFILPSSVNELIILTLDQYCGRPRIHSDHRCVDVQVQSRGHADRITFPGVHAAGIDPDRHAVRPQRERFGYHHGYPSVLPDRL